MVIGGIVIVLLIGVWFNYCLGGYIGDIYGVVVEWIEVLLLCVLVILELSIGFLWKKKLFKIYFK